MFRKIFKKKDEEHFWFSEKQNRQSSNTNATFARIRFRIVEYSECTMSYKPGGLWDYYVYLGRGKYHHSEKRTAPYRYCWTR